MIVPKRRGPARMANHLMSQVRGLSFVWVLPSSGESQLGVEEGVMFMPRKDWEYVLSVNLGNFRELQGTGWRRFLGL